MKIKCDSLSCKHNNNMNCSNKKRGKGYINENGDYRCGGFEYSAQAIREMQGEKTEEDE